MAIGTSRGRARLVAVGAVVSFGMLASAQAAVAAPFVRYAHFTRTDGAFYDEFGDSLKISVGNSPIETRVCVSSNCQTLDRGEQLDLLGGVFGQFWAHGQSREVRISACNSSGCMSSEWVDQLDVP